MHCEQAICQNLDKMDYWHSLQKLTFLCNYWSESNWVFCKMQVMSYIYITDNLSLIHLRLLKLLMRKVRLNFFGGTYGSYIMAPLHNICILTQIRTSNANFMQQGQCDIWHSSAKYSQVNNATWIIGFYRNEICKQNITYLSHANGALYFIINSILVSSCLLKI